MKNKDLKKRIIDISYKHKLSHLGSCLTACDIIEEIYSIKKSDEKFVLSSGHAGLALYCVIEKHMQILRPTIKNGHEPNYFDAEKILAHHGIHPDRCDVCDLHVSAGSLGQGLPIAVGMALSDRSKNVYCLISDGECSEGSIWEALRIATEQKLVNLRVYVNFNGWGAYKKIDDMFIDFAGAVDVRETNVDDFPFLKGQDAHYKVMNEEDYKVALEALR